MNVQIATVSDNVMPFLEEQIKEELAQPGCGQPKPHRVHLVVFLVNKKQGKVCSCFTPSLTHPSAKGCSPHMDTKSGFFFSFEAFCVCI